MTDKKPKVKWNRCLAKEFAGTGEISLKLQRSKFNLDNRLFIEEQEIKDIFVQAIRACSEQKRNKQFDDGITEVEEFNKLNDLVSLMIERKGWREYNSSMEENKDSGTEDLSSYDLTRLYKKF